MVDAMTPALGTYLIRLLDGPQRVGIAPEAVIREAERAGLVRYVRPHSRALTDKGRKALEVDA